jgi:predicted NBD/HSP70 family sugar kinase
MWFNMVGLANFVNRKIYRGNRDQVAHFGSIAFGVNTIAADACPRGCGVNDNPGSAEIVDRGCGGSLP